MPPDDDLAARLGAATPRDTVRGVVFNATFRLLVEMAGENAGRECDPAGKGSRHEFFSYPVTDYLRLAWAAADRLSAALGDRDGAFREMGSRASGRWLRTPLGGALLAFAGRDPRRLLAAAGSGYHNVVSYGTRTLEWMGERHGRLLFRRDFLVPPFHCGVLSTAVGTVCGLEVRAQGREVGFLDSEYDVTW